MKSSTRFAAPYPRRRRRQTAGFGLPHDTRQTIYSDRNQVSLKKAERSDTRLMWLPKVGLSIESVGLSHVGNRQFFAETYALLEDETLLVDVRANENCRILFFRIGSLKSLRSSNELWAMKFICNMLEISAHKNVVLSGRSFHISPRTIRERILSYLNTVSLQKHSTEFDIPFDRQQLADYLNVDRSALSNELSKLQREGIISCRKNHFELLSH